MLVDLVVQILAVGHQQEGEVARHLAAHLLGEERHRVGLAAALRVPEHAQPAEVGVRPLDDVDRPFGHEGRQRGIGDSLALVSRFRVGDRALSSGSFDDAMLDSRFSGGNSRFSSSCRATDATALLTPST